MTRTRIFRVLAGSPIFGIALGVCAMVGLGSLLALPANGHANTSASWTASPEPPRPLFLESGHEVRLAPDSTSSSTVNASAFVISIQSQELRAVAGPSLAMNFMEFSPLYRRPPPSLS